MLPLRNIVKAPASTAVLVVLSMLICMSMFAGSVLVLGMNRGLKSLGERLGADIIAVPEDLAEKEGLESIILDGTPGYFYMDSEVLEKIRKIDGVEAVSEQYFLASLSEGCCSAAVQLIGFNEKTDFTVTPWVSESYSDKLDKFDVLVGANVVPESGNKLRFYDQQCNVCAKLAPTGTEFDNAVFASAETIKALMKCAENKGISLIADGDPDSVVSSVYIRVAKNADIENIRFAINKIEGVKAVKAKSMLTGVAESMNVVSAMVKAVVIAIWIFCMVVIAIGFALFVNGRKKEFAVLRVMGMSRMKIAKLVMCEALCINLFGGVLGALISVILLYSFKYLIVNGIGLPYFMPGFPVMLMIMILSVLVSAVLGGVTAFYSAYKIARVDTGIILREAG